MTKLTDTLVARVAEIIKRYSMLPAGSRVGVAVSGGADSVALLHILTRLLPQFPAELLVLHANHQLRGEESDHDEEFVRDLAASLGLRVIAERTVLEPGNLEEAARNARREFFRRCREEHRLDRVGLGHTRSDQAETVLFRLFRGTGLAGLAGMRPVTEDGFVRPLLGASRDEIRHWASAESIPWCEDRSNADLAFTRNRIRHETIPALAHTYNINLEKVLAGTAELAQAEEEYWNQSVEPVYQRIAGRTQLGTILDVPELSGLHRAVQRRVLRRALFDVRGDLRSLEFQHIEAILALCGSTQGHDRVLVPGADALRSFGKLLLMAPGTLRMEDRFYRIDLVVGKEHELPFGAGFICVNFVTPEEPVCANFKVEQKIKAEVAHLDGHRLTGPDGSCPFYVRNWEPGDALHRPGHLAADKVKTLFQEHRILLWERRHWPVVVFGKEIAWVRGFGSAAKFESSKQSKDTLRLIYRASR